MTIDTILHDFAVGLHEYSNGRANGLVYGKELEKAKTSILKNYRSVDEVQEIEKLAYREGQIKAHRDMEKDLERLTRTHSHSPDLTIISQFRDLNNNRLRKLGKRK